MCNPSQNKLTFLTPSNRMSSTLERFLRYVQFDTQSDESSANYPSTAKQLVLLEALAHELRALGAADVAMDAHGYVTATVPSTSKRPTYRPSGSSPMSTPHRRCQELV